MRTKLPANKAGPAPNQPTRRRRWRKFPKRDEWYGNVRVPVHERVTAAGHPGILVADRSEKGHRRLLSFASLADAKREVRRIAKRIFPNYKTTSRRPMQAAFGSISTLRGCTCSDACSYHRTSQYQ